MMATYSPLRISTSTPRNACTCSAPISYTLASASVLITTPELTRSSRYESVATVSTGIRISLVLGGASALLIVLLLRSAVVHFYLGLRLQGAQRFVAADHDFVTGFQPLGDLNVSHAGNTCLDGQKHGLFSIHHKYALHFVLLAIAGLWRRRRCHRHATASLLLCIIGRFFQILARPHRQGLNGNRYDVFPLRCLDLGCRGKARPQILRRTCQRYDNFEVFCFLRARCRL